MSRGLAWRLITIALAGVVAYGIVAPGGGGTDRVQSITSRLRCPVCQGESVADSPSETARDITTLVREQVDDGLSDDEIFDFYAARYGEWVRLDPAFGVRTLALWAIPAAALLAGAAVIARQRGDGTEEGAPGLAQYSLEPRRAPPRRWVLASGVVVAVGALAIGFVAVRSSEERPDGGFVTGNLDGAAAAPRDLSTVTADEMEAVLEANPGLTGMRIAIIERHLREGDVEAAHEHSVNALAGDPTPAEYQQALKYNGWTLALLGDPAGGAEVLEASLSLLPDDRDAKWFLANVRLVDLADPQGAVALLEELDTLDLSPEQRDLIDDALERARAQL